MELTVPVSSPAALLNAAAALRLRDAYGVETSCATETSRATSLSPAPTPDASAERATSPPPELIGPEAQVAEIWRRVLGKDEIGGEDDFFEIGGHSLLLTQVASRVCETFNLDIPLRAFFDAPTVSAMTALILESQAGARPAEEVLRMVEEIRQLSPEDLRRLLDSQV